MDVHAAAEDWRRLAAVALAMARIVDDQSAGSMPRCFSRKMGRRFGPAAALRHLQ
jgi:hypothetical protein